MGIGHGFISVAFGLWLATMMLMYGHGAIWAVAAYAGGGSMALFLSALISYSDELLAPRQRF